MLNWLPVEPNKVWIFGILQQKNNCDILKWRCHIFTPQRLKGFHLWRSTNLSSLGYIQKGVLDFQKNIHWHVSKNYGPVFRMLNSINMAILLNFTDLTEWTISNHKKLFSIKYKIHQISVGLYATKNYKDSIKTCNISRKKTYKS